MTKPKELALLFVVLAPLGVLFGAMPPIPQDPAYHLFVDQRTFLGIPSFANIASNIAFLLVGVPGLQLCLNRGAGGAARSWTVFFLGISLVTLGSTYYHWAPSDSTLTWDRLAMTLAFTALFSAVIAEHIRPDVEHTVLRAATIIGILSVGWWHYTGDLRLYVWVQFGSVLAVVFVLSAFAPRYTHRGYLLFGLAFYALAKVAELRDAAIYEATGHVISGHTLKHLLAASAVYCVYAMLSKRKPLAT